MKNKNLKHFINLFLIILALTSFMYLNFAFCNLSFDVSKWSFDARSAFSIINVAITLGAVVIYFVDQGYKK